MDVGQVTLRYWASARAAAGVDQEQFEVGAEISLADLKRLSVARHPDSSRLKDVLACCAAMVGDRPATSDDPETLMIPAGATVELLPPFAGG